MPSEVNASAAAAAVSAALKRASEATGVGFDYLVKTAARESSFDPKARAKTSSAAGLFQFIEQTWLGAVKRYGARHGFSAYAADIVRGNDGRFSVPDAAKRTEILNLRFDAEASAALAAELAGENKQHLEQRLGRAAKSADLYLAHFLGPAGAVKLLSAAATVKAADILPAAAAANRHVFYDGARAKTVGEVVAGIAASMGEAASPEGVVAPASDGLRDSPAQTSIFGGYEKKSARRIPRAAPTIVSPPAASRLSHLAMSVLQALDPTRLGVREGRSSDRRN